jgi:protocatechuate 3,4-dioxygenase beta subunit
VLDAIEVSADPGQTWTIVEQTGMQIIDTLIDADIPVGTTLTEVSPGKYFIRFAHDVGVGYTVKLTNGLAIEPDTLMLGNVCDLPDMTVPTFPDSICATAPTTVLTATVQDNSGPITNGTINYYVATGWVNNNEDGSAVLTPITSFDPSLYAVNDTVTIISEFVPTVGTQCPIQKVSQTVIKDGCGASIGNYVWLDENKNGLQDINEVGVAGITVDLFLNGTDGLPGTADDILVGSTVTDALGKYKFTGLTPSTATTPATEYNVSFTPPANYTFTQQVAGAGTDNENNTNSDANPITGLTFGRSGSIALSEAEYDSTIDAGLILPVPNTASVGNYVWFDENKDGIQDASEKGISGVLVTLKNGANEVVATTITDANGAYLFQNVEPALGYTVLFGQPIGYIPTTSTGALTDATNSDMNPTTFVSSSFDVLAGDSIRYIDAGFVQQDAAKASLGDKVWFDSNNDGIQDATEVGVPNVTVNLYDATGGTVLATTTTDALGNYIFNNLDAGTYAVGFEPTSLPAGTLLTTQNAPTADNTNNSDADATTGNTAPVTLKAGENNMTIDAGIYSTTNTNSIGDYVWYDANKDGIQDANEAPVPGVTATLYNTAGAPIAVTTTDATGKYLFPNLPNGDYSVGFSNIPEGMGFTTQEAAPNATGSDANSAGRTATVSLTGGTNNRDLDAGIYPQGSPSQTASLGNKVWYDLDNDGIQDADETGVAGVTVTLKDAGPDGIVGNGDDGADKLTTTNSQGEYIFTNLPAGNYAVEFSELPAGYDVSPSFATDVNLDSDGSPISSGKSITPVVALAAGEENLTIDLGINDATPLNTIGNYVWLDANKDGKQDADEPGVPGVMVTLLNANGTIFDNDATTPGTQPKVTATDANGKYLFTDLPDSSYAVKFTNLPNGFEFTTKDPTNTEDGSDANTTTGVSNLVAVAGGQTNLTLDAGIITNTKAALGNYVWVDANADGIQDATEQPIAGVLVTLFNGANEPIATTVTDANGKYLFPNLEPAAYSVGFTNLPKGVEFTTKETAPGATGSDVNPATGKTDAVTLAAGDVNLTIDAGVKPMPVGGLGNYVWFDDNKDGIQDATEKGVAGITVTLKDAVSGDLIGTAVTDGNGYYLFPNLDTSKTYTATFSSLPTDYNFTQSNGAITSATNSDADATTGITAPASVTAGEINPNVDAGIIKAELASIGNTVFLDNDKDGTQGAADPGVSGITVTLYDNTGKVVAATITDGLGKYKFSNLKAGDYTVGFTPPADYTITTVSALADDSTDLNSDASTTAGATFGKSGLITLTAGEYDSTIDAGLISTKTQNVGDKVWFDTNKDGIQDATEEGVAGVTVTLKNAAGEVVATTVTNNVGEYLFKDVPAAVGYTMEFTPPVGTVFSPTGAGTTITDNNANAMGKTTPFEVVAGIDNLTIDAGIYLQDSIKASVGNKVWEDLNQNGIQDAGEPGIPGVTVTLKDGNGAVVATTVTNEFGEYIFNDLAPNTYSIDFATPTDYTASTPSVGGTSISDATNSDNNAGSTAPFTLAPGERNLNVDAGFYKTMPAGMLLLGDKIWYDNNKDGVQDANEPAVQGVTVTLFDYGADGLPNTADDGASQTTATDGNGNYLFTGLAPSKYVVAFSNLPKGYTLTDKEAAASATGSDANTNGKTDVIDLTANNLTIDAGIVKGIDDQTVGSLGNKVWYDNNGDGVQDAGELGVAGITVALKDEAGAIIATTTTDALGNYVFNNLDAGSYVVEFSNLPVDYVPSPTSGADPATNSDADAGAVVGTFVTVPVSLAQGENKTDIDFGIRKPNSAALGNRVWYDINSDGIQDATEVGVPGVTVSLKDATGTVIATTTTNANGEYMFNGLDAGAYAVVFSNLPSGYTITPAGSGMNPALDGNANAEGQTAPITLAAGETKLTVDAGINNPNVGSLGGQIWSDENADGIQDATEMPTAGLLVNLKDGSNTIIGTAVTDGNGEYLFTNLPFGDYTVEFTKPNGTIYSPNAPVGTPAMTSNDGTTGSTVVSITSADPNSRNNDAAYNAPQLASIGDFVWSDLDNDGIQDANEPGIAGVKVTLKDDAGNTVGTAITDENGAYQISDITPGTGFTVEFSNLPVGSIFTTQEATDAADGSNAIVGTGITPSFDLAAGQHNGTIDAGIVTAPSIGSFVWNDVDNDGIYDANELPVPGAVITVYNSDGIVVVGTATTDANGQWKVVLPAAGDYIVGIDTATTSSLHISDVVPTGSEDGLNDAVRATSQTGLINVGLGEYVSSVWIGVTGLAPLSVNLDLTGYTVGTTNTLVWKNQNQNGIVRYSLEKMVAGNFVQINTQSTGASNNYSYTDAKVEGINSYRVKAYKVDGSFVSSNIVTLSNAFNSTEASIYPNPTNGNVKLVFDASNIEPVEVKVMDALCRVVRIISTETLFGRNNIEIDLTNLSEGIYTVQLKNADATIISKSVRKN